MRPEIECDLRWSQELSNIYWREVAKFVKETTGGNSYVFWVSMAASAIIAFLALKIAEDPPLKLNPIIWAAIGYALCYLTSQFGTKLFRRKYSNWLLSRPLTKGRFSEGGISTSSDWGRSEYTWENVQDIGVSDNGFVLLLSGTQMIPVLNADLPDGLAQHEALGIINAWWAA